MSEEEPGLLRSGIGDTTAVTGVYDDWARSYDQDLADWDYRVPNLLATELARVTPEPGPVLDVGCGTGLVGRALRAVGREELVGIDVSLESLALAAEADVYQRVQAADVANDPLPFDDDSFVALVCGGVMTYLPDTGAVVVEFARVVRPGGTVLYTQRADMWDERDDATTLDRLHAAGTIVLQDVTGPHEYIPGNDDMGDIPVWLIHLRAPTP